MSTISPVPSVATDQVRATAAAARVSLVVAHAPTPPSATPGAIEAGRRAIKQAEEAAAAAQKQLRAAQDATSGRGVIA